VKQGLYYCNSHLQIAIDSGWDLEEELEEEVEEGIESRERSNPCCFELQECPLPATVECAWGDFCMEHTCLSLNLIESLDVDQRTKDSLLFLGTSKDCVKKKMIARQYGVGYKN